MKRLKKCVLNEDNEANTWCLFQPRHWDASQGFPEEVVVPMPIGHTFKGPGAHQRKFCYGSSGWSEPCSPRYQDCFPHLCLFTSSPWLAGKQIASMFFRQKKNKGASHEVLGDVAFLQKHSHLGLEWHRMRLTTAYRGTLCAPFSPSPASYMESEPLGPFLSPRRHFLLASMIEAG